MVKCKNNMINQYLSNICLTVSSKRCEIIFYNTNIQTKSLCGVFENSYT